MKDLNQFIKEQIDNDSKYVLTDKTKVIDAIKNSNVLRGSRGADIVSISAFTKKSGKKSASIVYQTYTGSYKICNVSIDDNGNVKKENWQPTGAYSSVDAAKKYVENDDKSISHDWKDEGDNKPSAKSDNSGTGKDFNIVGASAKNIANNISDVLGGSVIGTKKIKVDGVSGVSINAYEIKVGNKTFLIHDGVFKNSYSSAKGYNRSKGFTVTNANGEKPMRYKVNTAGTRFSNAYSTTAGELAKTIQNALLK